MSRSKEGLPVDQRQSVCQFGPLAAGWNWGCKGVGSQKLEAAVRGGPEGGMGIESFGCQKMSGFGCGGCDIYLVFAGREWRLVAGGAM